MQLVEAFVENNIGYLKMNIPEKLNALSRPLVEEMLAVLDEFNENPEVKVVILSGAGKAFCAGGDINSMKDMNTAHAAIKWIDFVSGLSQKIMAMDKYMIAAVHGYAAGAGFSIALAADFIVAQKDAKFALSFTNIGLIPDLGLIKRLTERVQPALAKEWISQGKIISAEEAKEHHLINRITEEDDVIAAATEFAQFIVTGPAVSNKYVKYLVNHVGQLHDETAFQQENMIQALLLQTDDHKEGVASFFEKRKAKFVGK